MNLDNKNKDQDTENLEGQEGKKKRLYRLIAVMESYHFIKNLKKVILM